MANLQRIRVNITGISGMPGVATYFAAEADTTAVAALSTFYSNVKNYHPVGCNFEIPGTGDLVNEADGSLQGIWTQSGGSNQQSSVATTPYAAGVGARIRWATAGIVHGRRVTGTTFLVPLLNTHYQSTGTILAASLTALSGFASTLVSTSALRIWSRPYEFDPDHPDIPARAGSSYEVLASYMPTLVTSLRSRRV